MYNQSIFKSENNQSLLLDYKIQHYEDICTLTILKFDSMLGYRLWAEGNKMIC